MYSLGENTHQSSLEDIIRGYISSSNSSATSVSGKPLSNADPQSTMGSNASTGLGGEVTHGVRDMRTMETGGNERPMEVIEETNRKSLFPVDRNPHISHV